MPYTNSKKSFGLVCLMTMLLVSQFSIADEAKTLTRQLDQVIDVQLHQGGVFVGQVVNSSSVPQENQMVIVTRQGQTVAVAKTDKQGRFVIREMPAGVYGVKTAQTDSVVRLWATNTAPPAAKSSVVLVSQPEVVRGQLPGGRRLTPAQRALLLTGGGTGIGLGIYYATKGPSSP